MRSPRRAWKGRLILRRRGMHACRSRMCGYMFLYLGRGRWVGPFAATYLRPTRLTRRQLEDSWGDCAAGGLVGADVIDYAQAAALLKAFTPTRKSR